VVQEAVEDGGGGGDVADELAPFFEWTVGGHERRAQLVAAHDDLEEVFAGLGRELFDAHVVDDEQVALEVALHGALVFLVESVLAQVGEDVEDGAVEDDFAGFDEFVSDGLGDVAFADAGRADEQDVFGAFEEASGGEVVDLPAVDGGVEAEVEGVEGALLSEVGGFGATLDHALAAHVQLVLEEQLEELEVVEVVAAGLAQAKVQAGGESAEAELAQGVLQVRVDHVSLRVNRTGRRWRRSRRRCSGCG